jgi:cytoskeleton protein RodZ
MPELHSLAQVLLSARQAQGLSLEALGQRLHMGAEQLAAFEAGDLQRLPEPVFVIAQARRIADALGVDISVQIESLRASEAFMAARPVLSSAVFQAAAQQRERPNESPQPSAQQLWPWRGALAWLLLASGLGAAAVGLWQQRQQLQPVLAHWSAQLKPAKAALQPPSSAPAPMPAKPPQPKPAPEPADLRLQAKAPSWLEVRPASGGAPLFRGRFVGERSFALGKGLRVRAGRPDLLMVSQGQAPPKPLGTISEIRWVSFGVQSAAQPGAAKPLEPAKAPARAVNPDPAAQPPVPQS